MIVIGLDHGNGHIKGVSDLKEVQSMSAFAPINAFGEGIAGERSKKHDVKEYVVKDLEQEPYLWGPDVWKSTNLHHSYTKQDRYRQKFYKQLTKIALAELANNGEKTVECIVVTGCPTQEANTSLVKTLEDLLLGDHVVSVNGHNILIEVKEVKVLPQPIGTVMDVYIDNQGFVSDESYEEDYVGIIDIGSGTTDLDGIKELNRQPDDTDTISLGMNDAYKNIAKKIKADHPDEAAGVTWESVEYQIRSNDEQGTYVFSKRKTIDISDLIDKVFSELADELIGKIAASWPSRSKFDKLLLTGGGAEIKPLVKAFKSWESDITVIGNSQMANARGFWKYGKAFLLEDHLN